MLPNNGIGTPRTWGGCRKVRHGERAEFVLKVRLEQIKHNVRISQRELTERRG